MSFWKRPAGDPGAGAEEGGAAEPGAEGGGPAGVDQGAQVAGERGIPSVNRVRSVQSRVSSILTVTVASLLAAGLLTWYYSGAFTRTQKIHDAAKAAQQRRVQGDTTLPSLGPIHMPFSANAAGGGASSATSGALSEGVLADANSAADRVLGPPPPAPGMASEIPIATANPYAPPGEYANTVAYGANGAPRPKTAAELALDRQLAGPVLTNASTSTQPLAGEAGAPSLRPATLPIGGGGGGEAHESNDKPREGDLSLAQLLKPTETPAVQARILPTQRFLLAKGAFLDCTLETAINSALPGMTTCITATDTFGADGKVVLLERGTKLVGETRGEVQQGAARLFVLWTEARTPAGVVVPLVSPGTDELGRSGLTGTIDHHWLERFGSAILVTIIDGVVQAETERQTGTGGTVVLNPSSSSDVLTDVLRNSMNIRPTIDKAQGDRIQIFVARDVDFRSVYSLRADAQGGE